jgi:pSer/pThr/pTyr-binding forkhead associated (FHA) protein
LLPGKEMVIGRDPICQIVLDAMIYRMVSRRHAVVSSVQQRDGHYNWVICDLNSANGTFLNGEHLEGCQELLMGDRISLGTDGFGLSDTRGALRRHFRVDGESIAVAALYELNRLGEVDISVVKSALEKYAIHDVSAADPGNTEGSG